MRNNAFSTDPTDSTDTKTHSLCGRRERLQMLMRLRSERQVLAIAAGGLFLLVLILSAVLWRDNAGAEIVRLGAGKASVEAQPLARFDPPASTRADPLPAASESPMAAGWASYYGNELAGNRTASGERFDPARLTAAHRTLPLGSRVRVTNPVNGESVIVRINDRGPYHGNRVIDLSLAAARDIGLIRSGTGRVEMALIV